MIVIEGLRVNVVMFIHIIEIYMIYSRNLKRIRRQLMKWITRKTFTEFLLSKVLLKCSIFKYFFSNPCHFKGFMANSSLKLFMY